VLRFFDEVSIQHNVNLAAILFFEEFDDFLVIYFEEVFFACLPANLLSMLLG
jgi:hypothetical protein